MHHAAMPGDTSGGCSAQWAGLLRLGGCLQWLRQLLHGGRYREGGQHGVGSLRFVEQLHEAWLHGKRLQALLLLLLVTSQPELAGNGCIEEDKGHDAGQEDETQQHHVVDTDDTLCVRAERACV